MTVRPTVATRRNSQVRGRYTGAVEVPTTYSELLRWATRATSDGSVSSVQRRALVIAVALARPHVPLSTDIRVGNALAVAEAILVGGHGDARAASDGAFDAERVAPTKLLAWIASIAGHTACVAAGFVGELADVIEDAIEIAKERDTLSEAEATSRVRGVVLAQLGS